MKAINVTMTIKRVALAIAIVMLGTVAIGQNKAYALNLQLVQIVTGNVATPDNMAYTPASEVAKAKAQEVISQIITPGMTNAQKVTAVHDYIVTHTTYDHTGSLPNVHTADGPILNGCGQCDGYAAAFKCYMDLLGIPNQLLESDAMGHAWNQVTIGGIPYEVDCTYDDYTVIVNGVPKEHGLDHRFLLLSSAEMINRHIIDTFGSLDAVVVFNPDGSYSWTT